MLTAYSSGSGLDKIRSLRFPVAEKTPGIDARPTMKWWTTSIAYQRFPIKPSKKQEYLTSLYPAANRTAHEKASQPCCRLQPAKGQSFKGRNTPGNRFQRQSFSFVRSEFPGRPSHPPARSSECAERASTLQLSSRFCGQRIRALRPD